MNKFGPQYNKDYPFKANARLHQSQFRLNVLKLMKYNEYGNRLSEEDAKNGKNFYGDYDIFNFVKKYSKYSKMLYADMLRSEHIPWNMFIPFNDEQDLCIKVLSDLLEIDIQEVGDIVIEYAPQPKEQYLNDATAFDTFIKIKLTNGKRIFLGIEVKYTEGAYPLKKDSKQEREVNNPNSIYYKVTESSQSFLEKHVSLLKEDNYRQIWRNYILAESMLLHRNSEYSCFRSITIYPKGNTHFSEKLQDFKSYLMPERNCRLVGITFEDLFNSMLKYSKTERAKKWISYLQTRYIVNN